LAGKHITKNIPVGAFANQYTLREQGDTGNKIVNQLKKCNGKQEIKICSGSYPQHG